MILVFREKLAKEASQDYPVCLVLLGQLDLKAIVGSLEILDRQAWEQWDQQVYQDLLVMWDLQALVRPELKVSEVLQVRQAKEACLADKDLLALLVTVNSVMALLLKQTDKRTTKDPKYFTFIMLSTLIESNINFFIHTVKSLRKKIIKSFKMNPFLVYLE